VKTNLLASIVAVTMLLIPSLAALAAPPDTKSDDELHYQLVYQRGIEAVLWSMPAMSDVFFRESMFKQLGMKPNQVMVMSKPLVARHVVLTANNQVNYAGMAYDLTNGAVVLEMPASNADYAVIGEICDNWQAPVTMVGVEGPDEGKGGKYLLVPPNYKDNIPKGYIVIRLEGFHGTLVFRPVVIGKGTMEGSVALGRQTRAYPLADAANQKTLPTVDGWDKTWNSVPVYDITWFENLAKFINDEPIRERDKVMIGMLSTLGIEKGKPFKPDAETTKALNAAVKDAYRIMQNGWVTPGEALTAWWPGRQWMNMNPAVISRMGQAWSFETPDAVWTYDRAITPFFWANYLPQKLGGQQLYLMGLRDSKGELLSGKKSYRLRVPTDVPVDKFWSVILYSQLTKSFVPNSQNQFGFDSYDKSKLKTNPDGTVDIYFGDKAPKGFEGNWLPSAGEDFFVIFRFYGPAKSVYEKTWAMPDIERAD
jgi:hypothetical protein